MVDRYRIRLDVSSRCFLAIVLLLAFTSTFVSSFSVVHHLSSSATRNSNAFRSVNTARNLFIRSKRQEPEGNNDNDEGDDDDDEEDEVDPYQQVASSEFMEDQSSSKGESPSALTRGAPTTNVDWGGALGQLRKRVEDVESGKSQDPSHVLFRLMSTQAPNQAIGSFISTANPKVVQAMSGAVGSLLGGLASPTSGVDTVVKATGDKVASLCFQLQMTGYLFRNAEYAMALKDLMKLKGSPSLEQYKEAFDRCDTDGSGFIEESEVQQLLDDVYDGKTPAFEIEAFLNFFDENKDGKISWEEFQRGLMGVVESMPGDRPKAPSPSLSLPPSDDDDEEEGEVEPRLSGTVEIEMEDGMIVEMNAQEYMDALKAEAEALKSALKKGSASESIDGLFPGAADASAGDGGIAGYIASRKGDIKSLTEGISPEIVKTMQLLVDFVLEGGGTSAPPKEAKDARKEDIQMSIPGPALQQLALWQLVLGYRLREAEVKGDYIKLLE